MCFIWCRSGRKYRFLSARLRRLIKRPWDLNYISWWRLNVPRAILMVFMLSWFFIRPVRVSVAPFQSARPRCWDSLIPGVGIQKFPSSLFVRCFCASGIINIGLMIFSDSTQRERVLTNRIELAALACPEFWKGFLFFAGFLKIIRESLIGR